MTLGDLIKTLEAAPQHHVVRYGFTSPHSYRGFYEDLAFEPAENVTVGDMLADARAALGSTYHGYKGGEYVMSEWTDVWLAEYGCCGEGIGPTLLRYMLGEGMTPTPDPDEERCADRRLSEGWRHTIRAVALVATPAGEKEKPVETESERIRCGRWGKFVSSPVPKGTVVRAWIECPECVAAQPEPSDELATVKAENERLKADAAELAKHCDKANTRADLNRIMSTENFKLWETAEAKLTAVEDENTRLREAIESATVSLDDVAIRSSGWHWRRAGELRDQLRAAITPPTPAVVVTEADREAAYAWLKSDSDAIDDLVRAFAEHRLRHITAVVMMDREEVRP